jgi:hypothetical protein
MTGRLMSPPKTNVKSRIEKGKVSAVKEIERFNAKFSA